MSKEYFNSKAAIWDEQIAERDTEKLRTLAESMDIDAGDTVLDVGTGTGIFVPFILQKIGGNGRLICMDYAEEMLQIARSKFSNANIRFVCADIHSSGLSGDQFNAVVCYSSFPHFVDKPGALKEIYRLLKQNGKLFICHSASRSFINNLHSQLPQVSDHLIPEDGILKDMLIAAGYSAITIQDSPVRFFVRAVKTVL